MDNESIRNVLPLFNITIHDNDTGRRFNVILENKKDKIILVELRQEHHNDHNIPIDIVNEHYQGKGIHRELIEHRLKATKGKSYCYIHKESFASLSNYRKSGFSCSKEVRKGTDYLAFSNL